MEEDERFYLDTSIWLDFLEKRGENGERAIKLIQEIINNDCVVFYSVMVLQELKNLEYSDIEIRDIFSIFKSGNIRIAHIDKRQLEEAERISKERDIPRRDVFHAILSRDNEAIMVTRDRHFDKLKDITKSILPEDII